MFKIKFLISNINYTSRKKNIGTVVESDKQIYLEWSETKSKFSNFARG